MVQNRATGAGLTVQNEHAEQHCHLEDVLASSKGWLLAMPPVGAVLPPSLPDFRCKLGAFCWRRGPDHFDGRAATGIAVDSPFILVTAVSHWPNDFAPPDDGLNWRVSLPRPAWRSEFAQRTLQLRHVQMRLRGSPCSS